MTAAAGAAQEILLNASAQSSYTQETRVYESKRLEKLIMAANATIFDPRYT
jgi:hypothetical protein